MGTRVTFIGGLIVLGGFLFLLFGTGVKVGYGLHAEEVVNLQKLAVAQSVIVLGCAVAICGVLKAGVARIVGEPEESFMTELVKLWDSAKTT